MFLRLCEENKNIQKVLRFANLSWEFFFFLLIKTPIHPLSRCIPILRFTFSLCNGDTCCNPLCVLSLFLVLECTCLNLSLRRHSCLGRYTSRNIRFLYPEFFPFFGEWIPSPNLIHPEFFPFFFVYPLWKERFFSMQMKGKWKGNILTHPNKIK